MSRRTLGVILIVVGLVLPILSLVAVPAGTLQAVLIAAGITSVLVGLFLVFGEEEVAALAESASEATPIVETAAAASSIAAAPTTQRDDLTKIEGIGPKLQEALYSAGFSSYQSLADTSPETIAEAVKGTGFKAPFNPANWPEQAMLAAKGDWSALEALQKTLSGGRA